QTNTDAAMRQLRDLLIPILRTADILARIDSQRFALLMPHTEPAKAQALEQRISRQLEGSSLQVSLELKHFDAAEADSAKQGADGHQAIPSGSAADA
ncbi:MAG: diguanylate cyclase, partial [Gammaproteobacteria bacterium]|nr:diguanylate cyclase [Gammaproteobacteria bacterium]